MVDINNHSNLFQSFVKTDAHQRRKALVEAVKAEPEIMAYILYSVQALCHRLDSGLPHSISSHARQILERIAIQQTKYLPPFQLCED